MKENTDNNFMIGSFKIIFRILNILDFALDKKNYDLSKELSPEHLKISENRFNHYLAMLYNAGYIEGVEINDYIDGSIRVDISEISITLEGLQYLAENSLMMKAAKTLSSLGVKVAELSIGI